MSNACLHMSLRQATMLHPLSASRHARCLQRSTVVAHCARQRSGEACSNSSGARAKFGKAMAAFLVLQAPLDLHAKENPLQTAQQSAMQSIEQSKQRSRSALQQAEEDFENSDFLKGLRAKSAENASKYKKDRDNKYCYRQAELGVGDCAGLRLIPGATKSGKQKTPEWLLKILGNPKENKGPVELPDYLKD